MEFISLHSLFAILILGWMLDLLLGDPARLPHPVVYMGKWIAFGEHRLNKGNNRKMKGAVFAVVSIAAIFGFTALVFWLISDYVVVSILVNGLFVFFCLAGRTLRKEVKMVFEAVDRGLEDGRKQVSRIVGRDTSELDAQEIRTAALETLAENLSDGVVAPLFWFLILGVPGMLMYKMINTFDSMIGYQNERYKDFGCWAAHIDDIANYIPARLTAIMMIIIASLRRPTKLIHYSSFVVRFANKHASPNSGWPESALAGILDCRFGGPHNYFGEYFYKPYIGTNPKQLTIDDMRRSINVCLATEVFAVVWVALIII